MEKVKVVNSLKKIIRMEAPSELDSIANESVYLLNVASKIEPKYISKQLGILLRNLNDEEIEYCHIKMKQQIIDAMNMGYEEILKLESCYEWSKCEFDNLHNIYKVKGKFDVELITKFLNYIYSKAIYENTNFKRKTKKSKVEDFFEKEIYAEKVAKDVCSKLIVLEVKDYQKLYKALDGFYNFGNDICRKSLNADEFIHRFIKLLNIIFLETDSHKDEINFNFNIENLEYVDFDIYNIASFFDNCPYSNFETLKNSSSIDKIEYKYIDSYIKNNKEDLNNLIFLVSKLTTEDDKHLDFNYKEYDLSLISILELMLVNSNDNDKIVEKFTKNILICLAYNGNLKDKIREKKIIREIYAYRSAIDHGNFSGYKNRMHNLEELLEYEPAFYEINKANTIEFLISKKLNFYLRNVFETIAKNKDIVEILKG